MTLVKKLGAHFYIDTSSINPAEASQKLGGAQVILATGTELEGNVRDDPGLKPNGKLMVVGVEFKPIEVTPVQLVTGNGTIQGWNTGTPIEAEDTLLFSELTGVRPLIETYPPRKGG
jgi:D-arabinose 1-dehydrogenase-like Zn-dependent alcohol dehydrogenase